MINKNAWFATQGNLMCAMLSAEEEEVRQRVVTMLLKNIKKPPKKPRKKVLQGMRQLQVLQLQWDADHWSKIIDLNKLKLQEPKIVSEINDVDLGKIIVAPFVFAKRKLTYCRPTESRRLILIIIYQFMLQD